MLTLEGKTVINKGVFRKRIEIGDDGIINKIGEPAGNADFVFGEEIIFPGFIDLHVHAREDQSHKLDYKEDFSTAGQAAVSGGVVAFVDMVNNPAPTLDELSYRERQKLAEKSAAEVVLSLPIGPGTMPLPLSAPYKVFLGQSVGGLFFTSFEDLENAIKNYSGQYVSFHCEDPAILEKNKNQPTHEAKRPPEAEVSGIEFALALIEKYKIFGRICHVSTLAGLNKIIEAKKLGVSVTVEVTPHHLYFDTNMWSENNRKMLEVNPPLRDSTEDRLKILALLKEGDIDFLASDHAPHTPEEKEKGASGMPHLDTFGPFVSWLMKEHGFAPEDIVRIAALNPARLFNKFSLNTYGEIKEGNVGSLTVLNIDKPVAIHKSMLKTKCGWSPFEGVTFPGSVAMTIIKGHAYYNA